LSADQAFANLLNRNAIAIPAASGGGGRAASRAGAERDEYREADAKLIQQVSAMLDDDEASDYQPNLAKRSPATAAMPRDHPTEVDLSPASARPDDLSAAHGWGAGIVGRDLADGDASDLTGAGGGESGLEEEEADSALAAAARVKRFSYLPLAGMNEFESGARLLAANLSARHPERPSLAVTGVKRGEGRSELAIRFALALARKVEHRILLADFDAEKPETALRLGLSTKHFVLADVLRGSCRLGEALTLGEEDNLYVLPSRAPERDGDEILDSRRVESLFVELHNIFDFVIIDCGPTSRADAAVVSRQAGSVVLAGRPGVSPIADMREAAAGLASMGANLAGMILVGA
jgi:Mrp family chromosome partitioning ATPase